MIRATFTSAPIAAAGADTDRRTIAGVAVPWNVEGVVSDGARVVFHPGSLDPTGRPVLLRDHDRGRPLGRVIAANDDGAGLNATARIASTRDGDEALVLAAPPDQVLGMFSVGVDPTDYRFDDAGTMHVLAGDWQELSLLPIGAYPAARVATVTATAPIPTEEPAMPVATDHDPDVDDVDPDPVDDDQGDNADTIEAAAGAGGLIAAAELRRRQAPAAVALRAGGATAARPAARRGDLTLAGLSGLISAGKRRGFQAAQIRSQITAALTNIITTDVAGFVRPSYRSEIVGLIDPGMPLVRAIQQRPLPASGMRIEYPVWTAPPDNYAKQAAQKTQIATGPVTVGVAGNDIDTWAQGNDISFQTLNRSDPSFIDAYLRAAAIDAGRKYDTDVAVKLLAAATAGVPGTSFVENVAALFAALDPSTVPPGPMFLAVSYDIAVSMIGVTGLEGPAFWSASINLGTFDPAANAGGLSMFTDWNLPGGTMLLGSRVGAASYGGPDTSADVRVVDVSLLGIDIGVYFYASLAIEYPGAFAKLTGIVAAATDTAPTSSSSSKTSGK